MKICGLNKLTLLDYPNVVAGTIFTCGCNLACPFCHNKSIIGGCNFDEVPLSEVFDFLKKRKGFLDGICVSGGEPTLQEDLPEFLSELKNMGYLVKLDTNGTNFEMLKGIVEKGLVDYVAMDIKSSFKSYDKAIGFENFNTESVQKSFEYLFTDTVDYEFRTTIVGGIHEKCDIEKMAESLRHAKRWFLQKFVLSDEVYKPEGLEEISEEKMNEFFETAKAICPVAKLRGM